MTEANYLFRNSESIEDADGLHDLYSEVFYPEKVGELARTLFHSLPGMKKNYWFIAEEQKTCKIVSAFALLPWTWQMDGVRLKVAEMGLVATRETHRNKGLMKQLNRAFDRTLEKENFHMAIIQGIPGFYHHFGFYYAVDFENHIDFPFYAVPKIPDAGYSIRLGTVEDIDSFMAQDRVTQNAFSITCCRSRDNWLYLMTESLKTEYGSEFWIMEHPQRGEKFYCRVPGEGFGDGLILSEVSEDITQEAFSRLLCFLKGKALKRGKPYIRLNLNNGSNGSKMAIALGAKKGNPYAWQVKIPDRKNFLERITPVLDRRIQNSVFRNYAGELRLDFFQECVDIQWDAGRIRRIAKGYPAEEKENVFCIPPDLFPALCTGYRTWQALQANRPDIFPANQYVRMKSRITPDETGLLVDVLFPSTRSWVYGQY